MGIRGCGASGRPEQGTACLRGSSHEHQELQMSEGRMNLTLKVWRQKDATSEGRLVTYQAPNVLADMSFLEMLDVVNEDLIAKGEEPIAFDSDCREGICGTCSMMINGLAHGGL